MCVCVLECECGVLELVAYRRRRRFRRSEHLALDTDLSVSGKPFIGLTGRTRLYKRYGRVHPYNNILK